MFLQGYHGTNTARAREILGNNFQSSVRAGLWLGDGIYFYQDAPKLAKVWAKNISETRKDSPSVLIAKLASTRMIDLTDAHYWDIIRELYEIQIRDAPGKTQLGMGFLFKNKSEYESRLLGANFVDHRLMNVLIRYLITRATENGSPTPQMVRAAFVEGVPVHPDSWLFDKASVIVSVFDPSAISDVQILDLSSIH